MARPISVGSAAITLTSDASDLIRGLNRSNRALRRNQQRVKQAQQAYRRFANTVRAATTRLTSFRTIFAAGLAVAAGGGIFAGIRRAADALGDLVETSRQLSIPIEQLQHLRFVVEDDGIAARTAQKAFETLSTAVQEAGRGSQRYAEAFQRLRIDPTTIRSAEDLFRIVDRINEVASETERIDLARTLLGGRGVELLRLRDAQEAYNRSQRENITATREQALRGKDLSQVFLDLERRFTTTFRIATAESADSLERLVQALTPSVEGIQRFIEGFRTFAEVARRVVDNLDLIVAGFAGLFALKIVAVFASVTKSVIAIAAALKGMSVVLPGVVVAFGKFAALGVAFGAAVVGLDAILRKLKEIGQEALGTRFAPEDAEQELKRLRENLQLYQNEVNASAARGRALEEQLSNLTKGSREYRQVQNQIIAETRTYNTLFAEYEAAQKRVADAEGNLARSRGENLRRLEEGGKLLTFEKQTIESSIPTWENYNRLIREQIAAREALIESQLKQAEQFAIAQDQLTRELQGGPGGAFETGIGGLRDLERSVTREVEAELMRRSDIKKRIAEEDAESLRKIIAADNADRIKLIQEQTEREKRALEERQRNIQEVADEFGSAFGNFAAGLATDFDDARSLARRFVLDLRDILIDRLVFQPVQQFFSDLIGGLLGGGGLFGGGRGGVFGGLFQQGGRPPLGRVSLVGEDGPELFVPDTAGRIIPNDQLGGGGQTININIAPGNDRESVFRGIQQAAPALIQASKSATLQDLNRNTPIRTQVRNIA